MRRLRSFILGALRRPVLSIAAAGLAVAACTVDGPYPGQYPGPYPGTVPRPEHPQFCPQIYQPVCAARGRVRQTFSNSCEANASGFQVIRGGECRSRSPQTPRPDRPRTGGPQYYCPQVYQPVCAQGPRGFRTYSSDCSARAAGARIVHGGECRRR